MLTAPILELDFELTPRHEATVPPEARGLRRDEVRLLVSEGDRVHHARFRDLPRFLQPGDLLVVNDSQTIPAAVTAEKDAVRFPVHFSTGRANRWQVEPRQAPALIPGDRLRLPGGAGLELLAREGRLWQARVEGTGDVVAWLQTWGRPIAYRYVQGQWPIESYRTIFGTRPGSAEMPSAGRPFSGRVLSALAARGVSLAAVTLHTGVSSMEAGEPPYPERFAVPEATVRRARGARRVIAVGTTVVRALESSVDGRGRLQPWSGITDLVVTPARGLHVCHGILTGLHEPRATHGWMLKTFLGPERLAAAYREALDRGYRWHEFGDVHLIL